MAALALVVGFAPARALAAPGLLVGVDDDTAKWLTRPNWVFALDQDLGIGAVRLTIPWRRGLTQPTRLQQTYGHRVGLLIALGARVVLAIYGRPDQAPTTPLWRQQYCDFVRHVVTSLPVRDVVVWNEANSSTFWPSSSGAAGYEALLATCWDTLHVPRLHGIDVIASTASHHDPAGFVLALGAAYRASGRTLPIADTFGHNPYPDFSAQPPATIHPADSGTIGQGDLPRLLTAYRTAFGGTGQPPPGTGRVTIWYLEDGFQTTPPRSKRALYVGRENDLAPVPPLTLPLAARTAAGTAQPPPDQASQLRDALQLAYCQPAVGAFFNFELFDERRLSGWQSGLLWADGTRKPSYDAFKATVAAVRAGQVDCSQVPGAGLPATVAPLPATQIPVGLQPGTGT